MGTINDLALLIPGRGNVLIGAAEAAVPSFASIVAYAASFSTAIPGFATLGHTDPEDLPEWGSDGGDTEVRRTWERLAVREVTTDPPVNYFVVKPLQFDNDTMKLYEGGGTYSTPNVFASPSSPAPTVASAIVVYLDGDCRPLAPDWLERLIAPIRAGDAQATGEIDVALNGGRRTDQAVDLLLRDVSLFLAEHDGSPRNG